MLPHLTSRNVLRSGLLLGVLASSANTAQAFTLIELGDHPVVLVSPGTPGPAPGSGPSETSNRPRNSISENGCFLVFTSFAKNLTPTQIDGNGASDVFLYNRCGTPLLTLVSHQDGDKDTTANGSSDQPVISPDGGTVVFRSTADDIVRGTGFGRTQIFMWDVGTDTFTLVSHAVGSTTIAGDGDSQNAVISRVGRPFVAFDSLATNLWTDDTNGRSDVFRFDSSATPGPIDLVSVPITDRQANDDSFHPDINEDGTCIVYESKATNLVDDPGGDTNNALDVFWWKFADEPSATTLVSHLPPVPPRPGPPLGPLTKTGDGASTEPSIDDGCKRVAFKSTVKDLALNQGDNNTGGNDVFVAERDLESVLVSHADGSPDKTGDGESLSPILSRNGEWVAYDSVATDLAPNQQPKDSPGTSDVFLFDVVGGKTVLVSHQAKDDEAASGDSSLPEISVNGQYVAYESKAKDLDPNQNDGNGDTDVFLYNRQWNNSILVSRRYASIAITGNALSFRPVLSGSGYFVAFTSEANNIVADDPDTSAQRDVFLFWAPFTQTFLTARSTGNSNTIEWVTPPVNYLAMRTFVSSPTCPATLADATASGTELFLGSPRGNTRGQFTHGPLAFGTYCYSIFLQGDAESFIPTTRVPRHTITGQTFNDPTGSIKWTFNPADTVALTQVGIGTQGHVAVVNDGGIYGFTRGPGGGFWSGSTWPFRVSEPIQGRPPIVAFSTLGATHTTFVGSQNGRGYAFDADRISLAGGALWYTTPKLGDLVQPGAAGMFSLFGGIGDYILLGARTGASATFYALDAASGAQKGLLTGGVGAISTSASVDYNLKRVYFTGQRDLGTGPTLWCLTLTATGFGPSCWAPKTTPNGISSGPVQRGGKVYVGDDFARVYAFEGAGGSILWGPYTACGFGNRSSLLRARRSPGDGTGSLLHSRLVRVRRSRRRNAQREVGPRDLDSEPLCARPRTNWRGALPLCRSVERQALPAQGRRPLGPWSHRFRPAWLCHHRDRPTFLRCLRQHDLRRVRCGSDLRGSGGAASLRRWPTRGRERVGETRVRSA